MTSLTMGQIEPRAFLRRGNRGLLRAVDVAIHCATNAARAMIMVRGGNGLRYEAEVGELVAGNKTYRLFVPEHDEQTSIRRVPYCGLQSTQLGTAR